MKKYNVNIDRPKPSSEEILAHRDFDSLMKQYKSAPGKIVQKPFYKTGWFFGSLATAAAVTVALVIYVNRNDVQPTIKSESPIVNSTNSNQQNSISTNQESPTKNQFVKQKISPPLKNLDVVFTNYKINSTHGGIITHNSGSKITIPANAFVDADGNAVKGNVEIKYREFRDQVDIFLAGIPMHYDSAGVIYPFESAGMMEIGAFENGKVVYLAKDKLVKVEFASKGNSTQFNQYKFDTVAGNWNYLGRDNVVLQPAKKDSIHFDYTAFNNLCAGVKNEIAKLEEPIKPLKADKHKNRFVVAVDPKEFPGMRDYQNVLFEVDESRTKFDANYYKTTWESVVASKGNEKDRDVLTLTKGKQIVTLSVYPVLDGKNYDDAMVDYNKKYVDYKNKLDELNEQSKKLAAQQIEFNNVKSNSTPNNKLANISKADADKAIDVMHVFMLNSFGIFNCDAFANVPSIATISLALKEKNGNAFSDYATLYHVDRSKNALFSCNSGNPISGFEFNPQASNLIWAVKNGILFYASEAVFATLPTTGAGSIQLDACETDFKSPSDMKKFFHIGQ